MDQRATQKSCIDKPSHKPRNAFSLFPPNESFPWTHYLSWIVLLIKVALLFHKPLPMPQTWQHLHQRAGKQFSHFVFTRSCIKERVQRRIKSEKLQFWQKLKVTTFFFLLLLSCRLFSNDTQSFANVGWHDWVLAFCLKWCQNALQRVTWVSANINCNLFYFSRLHWTSVVPLHYR